MVEGGHRGGALNLAARLCSIARAGEVLVSESVVHLAGRVDEIDYRHRGRAALKGFREPVRYYQAWFPLDLPPEPTQTRRTSHGWWTVAAVASLVAVGSLAALVVYKRSGSMDSSLPPNAVANVDTKSGKPLSLTQFRGSPTSLAVGMGYTWAADPAGSRIAGIQADGHRLVFVGSGGGGGVTGIAVAAGSLWAVHGDNGTIVGIDPTPLTTIGSPLRVGAGASAIVGNGDQLWVANTDDGTIQRVDATRSRVEAPIPVGSQPSAIAVGLGSVWVLDPANGALVRIDPASGETLTTTPVTVGSAAIAAGHGMVWVADPSSDTVIRYDADAGALRTVAVAGGPPTIAVIPGEVWAGTTNGRLVRIEPDSLRVVDSRSIGSPVAALTGTDSSLWVATAPSPAQHRGGTLHVAAEAFDSVDPALAFGVPQATVANLLTNDGLIAFRHVGGAAGSLLVPDLATAIPKPTDDGRTYRFVLRRGLTYSNGTPVRASDVRRGMERTLTQTPSEGTLGGSTFLSSLVGAGACTPG